MLSRDSGFEGQSIGRWLCGLSVLDTEFNRPVGLIKSITRNLFVFIPLVNLVAFVNLFSRNSAHIGDACVKTKVLSVQYKYDNGKVIS